MLFNAKVEGGEVSLGETVFFKADVEQGGVVVEINGSPGREILTIENEDGFEGGYIGGERETTMEASRCWL